MERGPAEKLHAGARPDATGLLELSDEGQMALGVGEVIDGARLLAGPIKFVREKIAKRSRLRSFQLLPRRWEISLNDHMSQLRIVVTAVNYLKRDITVREIGARSFAADRCGSFDPIHELTSVVVSPHDAREIVFGRSMTDAEVRVVRGAVRDRHTSATLTLRAVWVAGNKEAEFWDSGLVVDGVVAGLG